MVHVEPNNNVYDDKSQSIDLAPDYGFVNSSAHVKAYKPRTSSRPKKTCYSPLAEDLSRIRRHLQRLAEDFRQHEEKDLLHRKAVLNGRYLLDL